MFGFLLTAPKRNIIFFVGLIIFIPLLFLRGPYISDMPALVDGIGATSIYHQTNDIFTKSLLARFPLGAPESALTHELSSENFQLNYKDTNHQRGAYFIEKHNHIFCYPERVGVAWTIDNLHNLTSLSGYYSEDCF